MLEVKVSSTGWLLAGQLAALHRFPAASANWVVPVLMGESETGRESGVVSSLMTK